MCCLQKKLTFFLFFFFPDNVERVERDEEKYAKEKEEEQKRAKQAEGESRLSLLKKRARILRGEGNVEDAPPAEEGADAVKEEFPAAKKAKESFDLLGESQNFEELLLGGNRGIESDSRLHRLVPEKDREKVTKSNLQQNVTEAEKFGHLEKVSPWYVKEGEKNAKKVAFDNQMKIRNDPMAQIRLGVTTKKTLEELKEKNLSIEGAWMKEMQEIRVSRRERGRGEEQQKEEQEKQEKKKKKKKKKKQKSMEQLREERLKREQKEHEKEQKLLHPQAHKPEERSRQRTRYNNQYSRK
jgi:hypothetical protein